MINKIVPLQYILKIVKRLQTYYCKYNQFFLLASASLDSVTKLFEQVKAVKELQLGRREMMTMLTESIPSSSHDGKYLNEDPGEDGNDSDGESDIVDFDISMSENWKKVDNESII